MREIKFRAYDTEREIYVPQGEIIFKDYGETYFNVLPNCQEYIHDKLHNGEPQYSRFVIEQYTGLKDKNDVEIYESDIILYQGCKGEVYYCNDTCMFMAKFKTTHSAWSFDSMDDEITIIGNIHENPELLN